MRLIVGVHGMAVPVNALAEQWGTGAVVAGEWSAGRGALGKGMVPNQKQKKRKKA